MSAPTPARTRRTSITLRFGIEIVSPEQLKKPTPRMSSIKKGELAEYSENLNGNIISLKKETLAKIIKAMTSGTDVTPLFSSVIKCIITKDLELKKLVYLYLITHAKYFPEVTILAVNAFVKDSENKESPLIRALAIRTMGCIRIPQITEYLVDPLRKSVVDNDPYVRKTAALTVAKLYQIHPQLCVESGMLTSLRELIADSNQFVVANATAALSDIVKFTASHLPQNTGFINFDAAFTREVNEAVVGAIQEVSEWGLVSLLESIVYFLPARPDDAVAAAEKISMKLQHANPAVVIASIRAILHLIKFMGGDRQTMYTYIKRITPACVTLLSTEDASIQYAMIRCLPSVIQTYPTLFAKDIRPVLPKYQDPIYVKMEKLDLLLQLSTEESAAQILSELKEYCLSEVEAPFVRRCVRTIGLLAIKLINFAGAAVQVLIDLVKTISASSAQAQGGVGGAGSHAADAAADGNVFVSAQAKMRTSSTSYAAIIQEALVAIRDIIRCYPSFFDGAIIPLLQAVSVVDDAEARRALLYIIGEFASVVENAPDILAEFCEGFVDEPEDVQLALLTAAVKVFLSSPTEESQALVQSVLMQATSVAKKRPDAEKSARTVMEDARICSPDVRERGFFYWRLLSSGNENGFEVAKRIVFGSRADADAGAGSGSGPKIGVDRASLVEVVDAELAQTIFVPNLGNYSSVARKNPESIKFASIGMYRLRANGKRGMSDAFDTNMDDDLDLGGLYGASASAGAAGAAGAGVGPLAGTLSGVPTSAENAAPVVGAVEVIDDTANDMDGYYRQMQGQYETESSKIARANANVTVGDIFNAQPTQTFDVPYGIVLTPDKANGLMVEACFYNYDLYLRLQNTSPTYSLMDFCVQLNRNEQGLQPYESRLDTGQLGPGMTIQTVTQCYSEPEMIDGAASPGYVQIALKNNGGIYYFVVPIGA